MNLEFKPIDVEAILFLTPYFCKRPNKTLRQCDFGQLFMENVLSGALCSQ